MLKRTPFPRKQYDRPARQPMQPSKSLRRGVIRQVGDVVVAVPKEVILRSRPYRMWVATHECFFCRLVGFSQCCHENLGKGRSMKVCDSRSWPGCGPHHGLIGCHAQFDLALDGLTRDERRELGARLSAQMRERAKAAGWRFTDTEIVKP